MLIGDIWLKSWILNRIDDSKALVIYAHIATLTDPLLNEMLFIVPQVEVLDLLLLVLVIWRSFETWLSTRWWNKQLSVEARRK